MEGLKQKIESTKETLKHLNAEIKDMKDKIEASEEKQPELVRSIDKMTYQISLLETTNQTDEIQVVAKRDAVLAKLNDYKAILECDPEKLKTKKAELEEIVKELREKNKALNESRLKAYQQLQTKEKEEATKKAEEESKSSGPLTLDEAMSRIKIEKIEDQFLTYKTLTQIFDAFAVFISEEFCKIIDDYRKDRRSKVYKNKQFVTNFIEFEENTKKLIAAKQKEILSKINLGQEDLIKSIQYHISQGKPEVGQLYPLLMTRLRNFRESKRKLTKEELKKVLKLREELFLMKGQSFVDLIQECHKAKLDPNLAISMIQFRLCDIIFQEYGIEEEDVSLALKDVENALDPEIQDLAHKSTKAAQEVYKEGFKGLSG